ncbi:tRNA 2-selenouridine(34) synthase MnmH [Ramlibacter alkalitolerans]|uniref:tRNA 2-selenouridine(34) synthase MnmH n=1 Tax=Ramlibacter alkalitolerans TaxID=2039631 RepID=A0ABS1JLI9_9BURK|nr:tRNA 2-selenouridine(34) synthase MnmH [Ramlibacter alkalitolerans]MBL0425090.1 tRNA 2-selenouridine(34) synthase MnmH [Ramlibacter alkalitolerans]
MSVRAIPAAEAIARLADFDAVIDARSEAEYAEDHLPHAVNWPSLDNAQRHEVGTLYKQVSSFEARKRGAALVAANIARHIEREVMDKPKDWKPLVYCWRGGQRSGSLSLVLGQIGFQVHLVEGGYKAFRGALLAELPALVNRLQYRVVCGPTGSGKTRLLQALQAAGAQVLDLEALASHRSSVLGLIPGQPQPTQKRFDTLVWDTLRGFDPARPVYVESESRKVGNVAVPEALIEAMRASPCLRLDLPEDERVQLLLEDYDFFSRDRDLFCQRLEALTQLRGREQVHAWQQQVRAGEIEPVVRELLVKHYDPGYAGSTQRNFRQFGEAKPIAPRNRTPQAMSELAQELVAD